MRQEDPAERRLFAAVLRWTTRLGLGALCAAFAAYVFGWLPGTLPPSRVPEVWGRSAAEHLAAGGLQPGWGWILHAAHGDFAALVPIAWLASCSAFALVALLSLYARRRDPAFLALVALQLVVTGLAAVGIFTVRT